MKLFARIKQIGEKRTGVNQTTGNPWAFYPVVFEDPNGEDEFEVDVWRDNLPEGFEAGNVGWLIFSLSLWKSNNGGMYNRFRFVKFDAKAAKTPSEATNEAQGGTSTASEGEKAVNVDKNENGGGLPF